MIRHHEMNTNKLKHRVNVEIQHVRNLDLEIEI